MNKQVVRTLISNIRRSMDNTAIMLTELEALIGEEIVREVKVDTTILEQIEAQQERCDNCEGYIEKKENETNAERKKRERYNKKLCSVCKSSINSVA